MLAAYSTRFSQLIPLSVQLSFLFQDLSLPLSHATALAVHLSALAQRLHLFRERSEERGQVLQEKREEAERCEALKSEAAEKTQRVDHLERSRLRHYKQSRKLKEVSSSLSVPSSQAL
jgi:cell shape-determining protein MreC